jgi:hypothetical protein
MVSAQAAFPELVFLLAVRDQTLNISLNSLSAHRARVDLQAMNLNENAP